MDIAFILVHIGFKMVSLYVNLWRRYWPIIILTIILLSRLLMVAILFVDKHVILWLIIYRSLSFQEVC